MTYDTDIVDPGALFESEQMIVSMMKSLRPDLDLRAGTSLRDLLANPGGVVHGVVQKNIQTLRDSLSISKAATKENPDMAVVADLLGNIMVTMRQGASASGKVRLNIRENIRTYVSANYALRGEAGLYHIEEPYEILAAGDSPTGSAAHTAIESDAEGLYVILPFVAEAQGSKYNLAEGSALSFTGNYDVTFLTAEVYLQFSGGTEPETISDVLDRLPDMFSNNTLTSPAGIKRTLMLEYDNINDTSTVGPGSIEQSRGRHNLFGVEMGGRVDSYVRPFRDPSVGRVGITGVKVPGTLDMYEGSLNPAEHQGIYRVRSVNSPDSRLTDNPGTVMLGGYPFSFSFFDYDSGTAKHDFSDDPQERISEVSYTAWAGVRFVTGPVNPVRLPDGTYGYPAALPLDVEYYVIPRLREIQNYADSRTACFDFVVRGGIPIYIDLAIRIYRDLSVVLDQSAVKSALSDFINSRGIGDSVSISQLSSIVHGFNIRKVEFYSESQQNLVGATILDVDGSEVRYVGSSVDIRELKNNSSLGLSSYFSEKTAFTTVDVRDIHIVEQGV